MFCQNKTLFLKVKNRYIFRLAKVTHAEHEEIKKKIYSCNLWCV